MASYIKPPSNYAEWVKLLDMLKDRADDEAVPQAMQSGTIEWQTGVAERFSKKLIDTVNARMNAATDKFQKDMTRTGGNESAIVQALISLRKELAFLAKAINLPALPDKDRQQYTSLVISQADSIQKSLEDSAKSDRTGRLGSIVRNIVGRREYRCRTDAQQQHHHQKDRHNTFFHIQHLL